MFKMKFFRYLVLRIIFLNFISANNYCREILEDQSLKQINWSYFKQCLITVSGEDLSKDLKENIWRLMKVAFDSIDNIPLDYYKYMGYSLTAIPEEELRNISMENIDVIEAFGAIRTTDIIQHLEGFKPEQLNVLAQKVRKEWLGKNPRTYSEYDLKAMGEILCYLNVTDIEEIHADAFKEAAEWIGMIEKCPQDRLQALANLAKRPEAFGEPQKWSKLEVSIIGNILNGLPSNEMNAIAKDKLLLNHFFHMSNRKQPQQQTSSSRNKTSNRETSSSSSATNTTEETVKNSTKYN